MERVKQLTPIQMRSEGNKPLWQWDCIRYVFERINGKYSPPLTHTAPYTPLHLPSTPNRTPHNRAYSRPPADLDDHTLTRRHALVTSVPVQRHLKKQRDTSRSAAALRRGRIHHNGELEATKRGNEHANKNEHESEDEQENGGEPEHRAREAAPRTHLPRTNAIDARNERRRPLETR